MVQDSYAVRRRAKRDLLTLLGVVVILGGVVGANTYMRLDSLKEAARKVRMKFEQVKRNEGVELLEWDLLHETKGFMRTGPTFPEGLKELDGRLVNICGFMTPIDTFRNVTEYMLLPVPLTCYFCDSPPARDIIHIKLQKPTNMVNEPILNGGRLHLYEKGDLFFYTLADAKWNEAVKDEKLTKKTFTKDHMGHHATGFKKLREGDQEEELLPGQEPPTVPGGDRVIKADDPSTWNVSGPGGHVPSVDMGEMLPGDKAPVSPTDAEPAAQGEPRPGS